MISVFVTTNPFKAADRQYATSYGVRLPVPSADTAILLRAAAHALDRIWRDGFRYKKAGVMLLDLAPSAIVQGDLWTAPDTPRRKSLMQTIDRLNADHGRGVVRFASTGIKQEWKLRCDQRSPRYTTDWNELLRVN